MVGLSTLHTSPSRNRRASTWERLEQAVDTDRSAPEVSIPVGGSILTVRAAKKPRPAQRDVKRGKITGFSGASRKRLLLLFGSINRERVRRLPLFITLTYHEGWGDDATVWKRHLDTFCKRLVRRWPQAAAVWKLEFQARGAPHFHLLVFNVPFIHHRWVARCWWEVVGCTSESHLRAGTQVKQVKSWRGVMSYAGKYLGKVVDGGVTSWPGRFWGVVGREYLPVEWVTFAVTFDAFYRFRRVLLHYERAVYGATGTATAGRSPPWRKRPPGEWNGLTLWGEYQSLLGLLRAV